MFVKKIQNLKNNNKLHVRNFFRQKSYFSSSDKVLHDLIVLKLF